MSDMLIGAGMLTGLFSYTGLNSLIAVIVSITGQARGGDTQTELTAFNRHRWNNVISITSKTAAGD